MSLLVLPFSLFAVVSQDWVYGGHWCAAQGFFFTVVMVTQQLALLTISIDRNYAIMNSLRYPNVFTQTLCAGLIGFSWLFSVIISIPPLLHSGMGEYSFHRSQFLCGLNWSKDVPYLLVFSTLTFALPILIETFCYIKIFFAAVGHSKRSTKVRPIGNPRSRIVSATASSSCDYRSDASTNSSDFEDETRKNSIECKAVRTIFLIAVVYIVCWVPYFIDCFLALRNEKLNPNLSAAAICFLFSSSILNPMIYAYMNRVTRREISRFVCGISSLGDGEEAFSTSMSTYSPAWVQNKMRSKSNGGMNTETMDTIVEETEIEDSAFCEPHSERRLHTARCKTSTTVNSPRIGRVTHRERIFVKSENRIELSQYGKNNDIEVIENEEIDKTKVSLVSSNIDRSSSSDIPKETIRDTTGWCIKNSERTKDSRRRSSSKQLDSYFAKGKRRRKRDCGSFLYFEHVDGSSSAGSSGRQKKRRPQRFSLDHVQSISLSQFPGLMKFRLSLDESELKHVNKVTFKSDFEFGNKSFDDTEQRPKSSPEVLETSNVKSKSSVHTTEPWPDKVSVWTSIHRKNRPVADSNIENEQRTINKQAEPSATSNSPLLSNHSPPPNYLRLNSAPGRCERNCSPDSDLNGVKITRESRDTWDLSLPNETHI